MTREIGPERIASRWLRLRLAEVRPRRIRYAPARGLGGQTLADLANTLAVVVGLGLAPQLSDSSPGLRAGGLALGLLALGVAFFQWWRARDTAAPGTWYALTLATMLVGLFTIAANLVAIIMAGLDPRTAGLVAGIVGWPACIAWMLAEALNAYDKLTRRPKSRASSLSLFKSVCHMLGALLVWIYLILTLSVEPGLISWLFWTGADQALLGTLLGMLAGRLNPRGT